MATAKRKNQKSKSSNTSSYGQHVRASLLTVAPHKHTGKRLHRRHTSHGALLIFLIAAGVILFFSLATLEAAGITYNGQVNVSLTVPGDPPTTGAHITSPVKKSKFSEALVQVSGTCPSGNVVAIFRNGLSSASTICSTENTFSTTVQLQPGVNMLQAQNYDALDQPGPPTEQIEVAYDTTQPPTVLEVNKAEDVTIDTTIQPIPAPQPSELPCSQLDVPAATSWLNVAVPCITRNIFVGEKLELPIVITGGLAPFALSVDWGDDKEIGVYSLNKTGSHTLSHTYLVPQVKNISLLVADSKGHSTKIETVIEVNDDGSAGITAANLLESFIKPAAVAWFEASIPLYWGAVALFLGFWVGDVFQRVFGTSKPVRRHA